MATKAELLEISLLVIWNDRNDDRRLETMKKTYTPDVHFYELNTGNAIVGHCLLNLIALFKHAIKSYVD